MGRTAQGIDRAAMDRRTSLEDDWNVIDDIVVVLKLLTDRRCSSSTGGAQEKSRKTVGSEGRPSLGLCLSQTWHQAKKGMKRGTKGKTTKVSCMKLSGLRCFMAPLGCFMPFFLPQPTCTCTCPSSCLNLPVPDPKKTGGDQSCLLA